jgi:hypothetical protein
MRKIGLLFALTASVFFGGCATKGADNASAAPAAAAKVAEPRIAAPVNVPAASGRKVVMTMTGSKQVVEAKDWADFKREWRETFSEHAKAAGIDFSFVEGELQPQGQDGTMLLVNVADYRLVGIGARIMFGIMTGNAYIDAKIQRSEWHLCKGHAAASGLDRNGSFSRSKAAEVAAPDDVPGAAASRSRVRWTSQVGYRNRQPACLACTSRRSSGRTATGCVTASSRGRSLIESE